jgi:tetratricopeptide (TPR) repeat protein
MYDGAYEAALADCQRAAELAGERNVAILERRSQIYQHLGRFDEALKDLRSLDALSHTTGIPSRAGALNGLAYGRAIANKEISQGLRAADEALRFQPDSPAILDTRALLRYRQGDYVAALEDLERAIATLVRDGELPRKLAGQEHLVRLSGESLRDAVTQDKRNRAVFYYHRALVLDKLDRSDDAANDRARARKLIGREPDELLF